MTAVDVMPAAGSVLPVSSEAVLAALGTVLEPQFDQSVAANGFVRSVTIEGPRVAVRLRLPTVLSSPDLSDLVVADVRDTLQTVPHVREVRVTVDEPGHPDGHGPAAGAGSRDAKPELQRDLEELRAAVRRRAHASAVQRCCRMMLQRATWTVEELPELELLDLPDGPTKSALVRRRRALGLTDDPHALVVVDHHGAAADPAVLVRPTPEAACPSAGGAACPGRGRCTTPHAERSPATA